jgi:uncharacterized protein (DUF2336 family)
MKGEAGKAERLFRAAISAFCSLTRPSRREIAQLEDLALPLFQMASVEARRFAAATLSESEYAPTALVRLLCNQPVEVSAPLIIRSPVLKDIDLIALIGRHGLAHARVIARRATLNPAIADLIRALENPRLVRLPTPISNDKAEEDLNPLPGISAENARRRLRSMMVPPHTATQRTDRQNPVPTYAKLRDAAVGSEKSRFEVALAEAIGTASPFPLAEMSGYATLMAVLRYLYLGEEKAFLLMAATFPGKFAHAGAVRDFLDTYRMIDPREADAIVRKLKKQPAHSASPAHLKAS